MTVLLTDCLPRPQAGMTSLHVAAGEGHVAVVEQLLAAGANKEAKNMVRVGGGWKTRIGRDRGATRTCV